MLFRIYVQQEVQVFLNRDRETEVSTPRSRAAKHNATQNSLTCMNKMGRRETGAQQQETNVQPQPHNQPVRQLNKASPNTKHTWGNRVCMLRGSEYSLSVSSARSCLGKLPWLREFGLYPRLEWVNKASVLLIAASDKHPIYSTEEVFHFSCLKFLRKYD